MHFKFGVFVCPYEEVTENCFAGAVDYQTHAIAILDSEVCGIGMRHMNVSLSAYDSFGELDSAGRTDEYTAGCSGNIAAGSHGKIDPEGDAICKRQFNL